MVKSGTMKPFFVDLFVCVAVFMGSASGRSNRSDEHAIRSMLLTNYDKTVRPLPFPASHGVTPVLVEFGLKINRLVELDNKEEIITLDTWVVMKWNNSFLTWKPKDFGGMTRVNFLPTEIWFPDIVLYNNADSTTPRAGGRTKFLSNVIVEETGLNTWSGPATFTANCKLDLRNWPFDEQSCDLNFGSFSYDSKLLKVIDFNTQSHISSNYLSNQNWIVDSKLSIEIKETDFGNCCPYKFSAITYTLEMSRRFTYHMFYLVAPCLVLSILTLSSFWIPSESGERIGFVTTLLLGMMVFLLVVPASLPESSEYIPVLGLLMMATMLIITSILIATIFVLRLFHATGRPPKYFRRLVKPPHQLQPERITVLEAPDRNENKGDANQRAIQLQEKASEPTEIPSLNLVQEGNDVTWQMVASKLDKIFFCIALVSCITINSVLLMRRS